MDALLNYRQLIQDRILALNMLNEHKLSPALISPAELSKSFQGLEQHLLKNFPPFRFGFDDLEYFYHVPVVMYTADDDYIYVMIKVPLTVMAARYHVYEVFSVPLATSKDKSQYTQISNLPQYVAFSIQGDTYTSFGQSFLRSCSGVGVQRCPSRQLEVSTSQDSCILGLFIQDDNITKHYCPVNLLLTPNINELALDLGQGKFFISNVDPDTDWVIACPQTRPKSIKPCRSCVIALQCRCTLKTRTAFISASLRGCQNATSSFGVSKEYVPNLMLIDKLSAFDNYSLPHLNMSSILSTNPLEALPPLPLPKYQDVEHYVDEGAEVKTPLDKALDKVKKHKPVYMTKLQQLSDETKSQFLQTQSAIYPWHLPALHGTF